MEALVYVEPESSLEEVVKTLIDKRCSMAPIVAMEQDRKVRFELGEMQAGMYVRSFVQIPSVLHTATLGSVVACLIRHFQASISSLPFLSRPLSAIHLGTWAPTVSFDDDASTNVSAPLDTSYSYGVIFHRRIQDVVGRQGRSTSSIQRLL